MRRSALFSILVLCSLACSNVLMPTPGSQVVDIPTPVTEVTIPDAKIRYYRIYGDSEEELRAAMDIKAPMGLDGYQGDATTYWYVHWNWPGYGSTNCQLSQARVSVDVEVVFPRWIPPRQVSPDLVGKWNRYVLALAAHESKHVKNVVTYEPKVLDAIQSATCGTADGAAQNVLDQIRQKDADYDARTHHGETEGARFP